MRHLLKWSVLLTLLLPFGPTQLVASPYYCSPSTFPTIIESIEPQAAIAGVTKVYVLGQCFGDDPGTLTINGTAVTNFILWSDGEIVFTVPFTATTGNLVVASSSHGSDSSANEADCANASWCGSANISPGFYVNAPNAPPFYVSPTDIRIAGAPPSAPEYITGEWTEDNGFGYTADYNLTQGSQNSDGTWPVTGSVHWIYGGPNDTCDQSISGTLYGDGNLVLHVTADGTACDAYSEELAVLSSGAITSQGYIYPDYDAPLPLADFPKNLGDMWSDLPLVSSTPLFPADDSPSAQGWGAILGSEYPTQGLFNRTMPSFPGFVEFAGRFVYEQDGGDAFDGCYTSESITPEFTGVTGGGWYVNASGVWGPDVIGMWSQGVDWYQQHEPDGCTITVPQAMNVNTRDDVLTEYSTNQLVVKIWSNEVCTEVETQDLQTVKQGLAYPPTPGTAEGPTCLNDH